MRARILLSRMHGQKLWDPRMRLIEFVLVLQSVAFSVVVRRVRVP